MPLEQPGQGMIPGQQGIGSIYATHYNKWDFAHATNNIVPHKKWGNDLLWGVNTGSIYIISNGGYITNTTNPRLTQTYINWQLYYEINYIMSHDAVLCYDDWGDNFCLNPQSELVQDL